MQGLVLMGVGMGMVLAFLVLMILLMALNAKFIPRFSYLLPDEPAASAKPRSPRAASGDADVAVAIAAARRRAISG